MSKETFSKDDVKDIIQKENCRNFLHLSLMRAQAAGDRPEVIDAGISMFNQFVPKKKQLKRVPGLEIPEIAEPEPDEPDE